MSTKPYKLRCSLPGHSKDVRCVTVGNFAGEECIISGSRDKTAKFWAPEGLGFICNQTFGGSEGYISAVAVGLPSESLPSGAVITGCQDGKIKIYNPEMSSPSSTLNGHTDTVCALAIRPGFIMSGSWDKTARIWQFDGSTVLTLTGHTAAIWAVEVLKCSASPSEIITLTGSADKTIKMWLGDSPLQLFKGHTDCVRALAVVDANRFLSAANDATIKLWVTGGECLSTFYGHTNYIYGLCMMPDSNDFVSCGEDRSLRIWKLDKSDECQQSVFLPAQSVWTVTVMKNGDIVSGSSDGLVRVFTNSPDRAGDPDMLQLFEEELAATSLSAQLELGGIKASDLPGPESLFEPGHREGQTKMVRQGETVSCYSWSSSDGQWTKVGDVVGAAGQSDATKTLYEGKEYDFVFSVDITEGQVPLKLPYNTSEDPWLAAQKFIHKHDLSQYYLDTVANFIITNSKGAAGGGAATASSSNSTNGSSYVDPFTGGSRYVPSSGNAASSASQGSDPFTGSGRYVPPSSSSAVEAKPTNSYFPVREFLRFDLANIDAISNKLKEFNNKIDEELRLSESQLLSFIKSADLNSNLEGIHHLDKLLLWSSDMVFPVLDILRLCSRNPRINQLLVEKQDLLEILLALSLSSVPNCMLVYRTVAHLLMHATAVQSTIMNYREIILTSVSAVVTNTEPSFSKHSQWKNIEIAISTVILNFAALLQTTPSLSSIEIKSNLLSTIATVVSKLQEEEALFRILAALGTMLKDEESIAIARSIDCKANIEHLQNIPGKVGECAKLVLSVF